MSAKAVEMVGVRKRFRFFQLEDVSLDLEPGQIMGFVGPNGAGKSTTLRILMGFVAADAGDVRLLGHPIPHQERQAKRNVGLVSDDMRLFQYATVGWHMRFMASIYPQWDAEYAATLLKRFNLHPEQTIKNLSTGEHSKAALLLALARRPRLLILDEPTSGLDPVARHEVLGELMEVVRDERRAILMSSHNTVDVERVADRITFIDRGRIVDSSNKEEFLERWRRVHVQLPDGARVPKLAGIIDTSIEGRLATLTSNDFAPELAARIQQEGARILDVQRMNLEEIFVANVMHYRREREA